MGWKTINDRLALLLLVVIPLLWVGHKWLNLPGEVIGASIMAWTLVLQYYFRKSPPASGTDSTPPTGGMQP